MSEPAIESVVTASVRGFCERVETEKAKKRKRPNAQPLPNLALVFDTETTTDFSQRLTFGSYALYQRDDTASTYQPNPIARGLFYGDGPGVPDDIPARLAAIATSMETDGPLDVMSQTEFLERVFLQVGYRERGLVVAFNLPFDLSRIARHATAARKSAKGGFSFVLWPRTRADRYVFDEKGSPIDRAYRPRITVKPLGPHKASIRFTSVRHHVQAADVLRWSRRLAARIGSGSVPAPWDERSDAELAPWERYAKRLLDVPKALRPIVEQTIRDEYLAGSKRFNGRFLDLHTLGHALTDRSMDLRTSCKLFGVKPKGKVAGHPGWDFDGDYVRYNLNDTESTGELLNAMLTEYARHPIALEPDRAFSSASIGKAYLRAMGVTPLLERWPDFPRDALGIASCAFYGGRTSVRIRRAIMPVVYCDFLSMYPTVNALLGTVELLRARKARVVDCTDDVRELLAAMTVDALFEPVTWRRFGFFAQVELDGSGVFPVRAVYEQRDAARIGMVHATSDKSAWYAGPDVIASFVMTGTRPTIRRAIRIEPECQCDDSIALHEGLAPVNFMGSVPIDPRKDDIFARVIEERQRVKRDASRSTEEKKRLDKGLKVFASGTGYGIWSETNVADDEKVENVRVTSGDENFELVTDAPEDAGPFSFMPIASLITAGAHLMLALLERCVTERGGCYVLEDTDSMAIVATERGGRVPCPNGSLPWSSADKAKYCGPEKDAAASAHALSWADVDAITQCFAALSPYGRDAVPGSILKTEDVNFRPDGTRRQLYAFAVSSKRYALFELDARGEPVFRVAIPGSEVKTQYSESGLGGIANPLDVSRSDDATWIEDFWRYIVCEHLGLPMDVPTWFHRPVVARIPVSSPVTWKAFGLFNAGKTYDESVKPYGFALTARIATGTLDAIVERPASLPHWLKQVAAEADAVYDRRNAEAVIPNRARCDWRPHCAGARGRKGARGLSCGSLTLQAARPDKTQRLPRSLPCRVAERTAARDARRCDGLPVWETRGAVNEKAGARDRREAARASSPKRRIWREAGSPFRTRVRPGALDAAWLVALV